MKVSSEAAGELLVPAPVTHEVETTRRRLPWWGWTLLGLAVVVGVGVLRVRGQVEDPAAAFQTAKVEPRRLTSKVTATGTLSALVTVQVGSQVSGRIQELSVDFNSPVKKGQVIARIDPQLFQAAVERARANLVAARANVTKARVEADNARKQAERSKALRDKQFISQADLDTAESTAQSSRAQVSAAEGQLAQAQAALSEADVNLRYTTIVSPTDGIVISRSVDVGQTVAASLQAPTLFTIAEDLRKMQVNTSVSEADVGRLEDGMRATFTVDAWPGERFHGTIRQIRNAATTVQNVVTYDAIIDVDNPDLKLKPGMTANVTIVTAQKDQALAVPNAALRFRPAVTEGPPPAEGSRGAPPEEDGRRTVYLLRAGQTHPTPARVKTGLTDGSYTELSEGDVKAGDVVVIGQTTSAAAGGAPPAGGRPPMRRGPGPF
ncbi:efflux RND transporter periplasmic adaptor subunit [Myxococcus sp. K38C18041901]|uniref:efflux RND transporter periplasmic adaptor subunit n=1 Tax=Myxococcus guangdongensis TaxID=2906760 RepID=UPI0020A79A12|nr:efflux RND transporter periplasmic adaptor subunit [Myxococcus guangdongensis]MCP3063183.1 efflux RND transporter periplasmic adaptor subunit [Myxococcus guangdongensis]